MNKDAFLRELIADYVEHEHMDIDGGYFQEILEKHGFIEVRPITEGECQEEWTQEYGYKPGDDAPMYTEEMKAFIWPRRKDTP